MLIVDVQSKSYFVIHHQKQLICNRTIIIFCMMCVYRGDSTGKNYKQHLSNGRFKVAVELMVFGCVSYGDCRFAINGRRHIPIQHLKARSKVVDFVLITKV